MISCIAEAVPCEIYQPPLKVFTFFNADDCRSRVSVLRVRLVNKCPFVKRAVNLSACLLLRSVFVKFRNIYKTVREAVIEPPGFRSVRYLHGIAVAAAAVLLPQSALFVHRNLRGFVIEKNVFKLFRERISCRVLARKYKCEAALNRIAQAKCDSGVAALCCGHFLRCGRRIFALIIIDCNV